VTAHDAYEIETHDRILVLRLFDAWDQETTERYIREVDSKLPAAGQPWAMVSDVRRWGLPGLKNLSLFQDQALRHTEHGRSHGVFLIAEHHELLAGLIQEAVGQLAPDVVVHFAHDDEAAARWLEGQGFDASAFRASLVD